MARRKGHTQAVPDNPALEWCPECEGYGTRDCDDCGGSGSNMLECDMGYEHELDCCSTCEGGGTLDCSTCGGEGTVPNKDYAVDEGL